MACHTHVDALRLLREPSKIEKQHGSEKCLACAAASRSDVASALRVRLYKSIEYIDAILRGELFWSIYCQYLEGKQSIYYILLFLLSCTRPRLRLERVSFTPSLYSGLKIFSSWSVERRPAKGRVRAPACAKQRNR